MAPRKKYGKIGAPGSPKRKAWCTKIGKLSHGKRRKKSRR